MNQNHMSKGVRVVCTKGNHQNKRGVIGVSGIVHANVFFDDGTSDILHCRYMELEGGGENNKENRHLLIEE